MFAAALGVTVTHAFRHWVRARGWLSRSLGALFVRILTASTVIAVPFVVVLGGIEFYIFGDQPASKILVIVFASLRWAL